MKRFISIVLVSIIIFGCSTQNPTPSSNTSCTTTNYQTITIGSQIWMPKNLDVDHYRNGDAIPQVTDPNQWVNLRTGAWCYYNNDPVNCNTYGKLYNWYAVNDPRGLAPQGWHVPSDAEWTVLSNFLEGTDSAGGKMKESGTLHWALPNIGATNSSGFTALPAGDRYPTDGSFVQIGQHGSWWSSTQNSNTAYMRGLMSDYSSLYSNNSQINGTGYSVRCVKD